MKIFCINAWSLKPMNITKCCVSSLRWSARAFTAATSSLSTFSFVCSNWKKLVEIRWVTWSLKSIAFPCLEKLGLLLQDAFGSLSVCTVKRWPIKFCSICLNLNSIAHHTSRLILLLLLAFMSSQVTQFYREPFMSMPKYFSHCLIIFIQVHLILPKYLFSKLRKLSLVEVYRSKTTKKTYLSIKWRKKKMTFTSVIHLTMCYNQGM